MTFSIRPQRRLFPLMDHIRRTRILNRLGTVVTISPITNSISSMTTLLDLPILLSPLIILLLRCAPHQLLIILMNPAALRIPISLRYQAAEMASCYITPLNRPTTTGTGITESQQTLPTIVHLRPLPMLPRLKTP
jgi:hypothetical protein